MINSLEKAKIYILSSIFVVVNVKGIGDRNEKISAWIRTLSSLWSVILTFFFSIFQFDEPKFYFNLIIYVVLSCFPSVLVLFYHRHLYLPFLVIILLCEMENTMGDMSAGNTFLQKCLSSWLQSFAVYTPIFVK